MSTSERFTALLLGLAIGCGGASAQTPKLGKPIAEADIAAWDINAAPDGSGLPPGRGTPAQGAKIYVEKCQVCHGEKATGKPYAALVGGAPLSTGIDTTKTVFNFWGYSTIVFD